MWKVRKLLQILIAIAIGSTAAACGQGDRSQPLSDEISREQVRRYLLDHPELVLDDPEIRSSIHRARSKREQEIAASWRESVLEEGSEVLNSPLTPSSGDASAEVTIVAFYDYQCGPCIASHPELEQVRSTAANVRIVFGQLPIFGSHSIMAARAAIAANRQGRFDGLHAALMTANARLDMDTIYAMASEVGLDVEQLRADMRDPQVLQYLEEVRRLAEELGVTGTPAFVIGDQILFGGTTAADLETELDRQRARGHQHAQMGHES